MKQRLLIGLLVALLAGPAPAQDSAVVFMYHRFGEDRFPATNVRVDAFSAQLEWLAENGFTVIGLPALLAALDGNGDLPARAVVITVDDAYASILDHAWPLLKRRGWPFTVFVATDPVDEGYGDYLDWSELRRLAGAGVTFANHGAAHDHLATPLAGETPLERAGRVRADLKKGARRLHEELGDTGALLENVFAYPYGEYDTVTAEVVRALGWTAFGQQSGAVGLASDRRALPRYAINETYSALDGFATRAASLPLPVVNLDPWDPVTGPEPVLTMTLAPGVDGLESLACYVGGQGAVPVQWLEPGRRFRVAPIAPLAPGRQRVNCTAPGPDGRYRWFGHQWLVSR